MRKKLLWASDSTYLPTGYANQTRYILNTLSQIYDGYLFSHQYPGQEEMRDNYVHIPGGHSAYGKDQIDYYIGKYKPDMTAWLCDAFMINWLHENGSLGGAGKRKKLGWILGIYHTALIPVYSILCHNRRRTI